MLQGQSAVVTGAADGIGLAIATKLAENGARVVLSDIRRDRLEEVADGLAQDGHQVRTCVADASKEEDIRSLIETTAREYGSVDILVNNAGRQHVDAIEDFPTDKFEQLIHLMLIGPFLAMKYAIPLMKAKQHGRIITVASINGLIGFAGKAAYNAAKHGVIGLTKVAALELATEGITVNALCPGYVETALVRNQLEDIARLRKVTVEQALEEVIYPLVPQHRLLDPDEVAEYALFLASEKAKSVTGQAVVIDGGYVAQ